MDQILNKVRSVDPNNSDALKEVLVSFFQKLPKENEPNCNAWLRELRNVIDRFPKYCMSHRINMEKYFVDFLSSSNLYRVIEVAKCAHALQQVRPTKEKTATPKSSWRDQMSLLCNAAHSLITAIFPNAIDIYKDIEIHDTESAKSPLSEFLSNIAKLGKNVKDKNSILKTRLTNVFVLIQAMLVETYPVAKPIQPRVILDVIVRALSVTSSSTQEENVTSVKIQALRTLDALILCLGSNLIPFSPLIFRLVMQTLRWSSDNPSEENRKVRTTAYNTLTYWFTTLHTHRTSDNSSWEDDLSTHIIEDVVPQKKIVQLTMGPQPTKNLSKKARRKLANSQLQQSTISAHMPGERNKISVSEEVNNEVALAALECAEAFLTVCGRFLKPATHKLFQENIIRECFNHVSYEEDYILSLLHVLEASRKSTPNSVPPPTQYCLQLYSILVNMQNTEISKFCSQALLNIRLHLHCSPPSINYALEIPQETIKPTNKRKKVSERNRAALESLLGKDKVPSEEQEQTEDIITIADEPSNKKPRIVEEDKISLSSEEIEPSVEISDDSDEDMVIEVPEISRIVENGVETAVEEKNLIDSSTNKVIELTQVDDKEAANNQNSDKESESVNEIELKDKVPIHEAVTQLPLDISSDAVEETISSEVGYDYSNTEVEKVVILEKNDTNTLPSTNETDDIQITCGQIAQKSQDIEENKSNGIDNKECELPEGDGESKTCSVKEVPIMNGDVQNKDIIQNGDISKDGTDAVDSANDSKVEKNCISVEDMLADFVDEVNEEAAEA